MMKNLIILSILLWMPLVLLCADKDNNENYYLNLVNKGDKALITVAFPKYGLIGHPGGLYSCDQWRAFRPTEDGKGREEFVPDSWIPSKDDDYEKRSLIVECQKVDKVAQLVQFAVKEQVGESKEQQHVTIYFSPGKEPEKATVVMKDNDDPQFEPQVTASDVIEGIRCAFVSIFIPPADKKECKKTAERPGTAGGGIVRYEQKFDKGKNEWRTTAVFYESWSEKKPPPKGSLYWDEAKKDLVDKPSKTAKKCYHKWYMEEQTWKPGNWIWSELIRTDYTAVYTEIGKGVVVLKATAEIQKANREGEEKK